MKNLFLLALLTLAKFTNAQNTCILQGTINADTGTMYLCSVAAAGYYSDSFSRMSAPVMNGKFVFKRKIKYPEAYNLRYAAKDEVVYISGSFIADTGVQAVACNIDSLREVPRIENRIMREQSDQYNVTRASLLKEYNAYNHTYDSIRKAYNRNIPADIKAALKNEEEKLQAASAKLLLQYTRAYPNSYVALWKLVEKLGWGYGAVYEDIYKNLSTKLKSTVTGKELANRLSSSSILSIGNPFPSMKLVDTAGRKITFTSTGSKAKYTLVDFWFSHCAPCKRQFPKFRAIYDKHHANGFEIVQISVDDEKSLGLRREIISKQQLCWPQYLDKDGVLSTSMSVNKFPTNYLLDANGIIIQYDIDPDALDAFLTGKSL